VCVQNSMHQNCPVCFEYLFDSVRPITVLLCGHTIHQVRATAPGPAGQTASNQRALPALPPHNPHDINRPSPHPSPARSATMAW
jgi:hypothetical protein